MGHVNNRSLNIDVNNSNFIIFTTRILQKFDIKIIEIKTIIQYFSDLGKCQTYEKNDHSILHALKNEIFHYHVVLKQ